MKNTGWDEFIPRDGNAHLGGVAVDLHIQTGGVVRRAIQKHFNGLAAGECIQIHSPERCRGIQSLAEFGVPRLLRCRERLACCRKNARAAAAASGSAAIVTKTIGDGKYWP